MASDDKAAYEVEYNAPGVDEKHRSSIVPDESGAVHGESFVAGNTLYHKLQRFVGRYGVEQRGIERVPEDERTDRNTYKLGTMWCAANMVVSSFAIGALAGPVFGLGFVDSLLTIMFINILGTLPVAFFSTFGPRFGMRQMILSRFFFGYYGVKISKHAPPRPPSAAVGLTAQQSPFLIVSPVSAGPPSMSSSAPS